MALFFTAPYQVSIPTPGAVVDGDWVPGLPAVRTVLLNVQPPGSGDYEAFDAAPGGRGALGRRVAFADERLPDGTMVAVDGKPWEVMGSISRRAFGESDTSHYKHLLHLNAE